MLFGPCSRTLQFSEFFSVPASGGGTEKGCLLPWGGKKGGGVVGCFLCCGWVGVECVGGGGSSRRNKSVEQEAESQ